MLPLERTNQAHMYISGYAVPMYACQTLWYLCMCELNLTWLFFFRLILNNKGAVSIY